MRRQNRNNLHDIENQPSLKSTMKITVPSIPSSLPSVDELPHISPLEIQHIPNGHHGERHVLSPRTRPSFSPWRGKLTINLPVTRKGVERNGGHIPRSGINPRQKSGMLRPRRGIIDAHVDIIPAPAFSRERERERELSPHRAIVVTFPSPTGMEKRRLSFSCVARYPICLEIVRGLDLSNRRVDEEFILRKRNVTFLFYLR